MAYPFRGGLMKTQKLEASVTDYLKSDNMRWEKEAVGARFAKFSAAEFVIRASEPCYFYDRAAVPAQRQVVGRVSSLAPLHRSRPGPAGGLPELVRQPTKAL